MIPSREFPGLHGNLQKAHNERLVVPTLQGELMGLIQFQCPLEMKGNVRGLELHDCKRPLCSTMLYAAINVPCFLPFCLAVTTGTRHPGSPDN